MLHEIKRFECLKSQHDGNELLNYSETGNLLRKYKLQHVALQTIFFQVQKRKIS